MFGRKSKKKKKRKTVSFVKSKVNKKRKRLTLAERKSRARKIVAIIVLSVFVFLFSFLAWLSQLSVFSVDHIGVNGTVVVNQNELKILALKETFGNHLFFFARRNILLYSTSELEDKILDTYPRIKTVNVKRVFPRNILIEIKERSPYILWCDDKTEGNEQCYIADDKGYIFEAVFTDIPNLIRVYKGVNQDAKILRQTIAEDKFATINDFLTLPDSRDLLEITKVDVLGEDANFYTSEGWFVKVPLDKDQSQILENLKTVLNSDEIKALRVDLEYIDLRFGKRIFYKVNDVEFDSALSGDNE